MLVSTFNTTDPLVLGVSNSPQIDARENAERFMYLPLDQPDATQWDEIVNGWHVDFPYEYFKTFAAFAILMFSLVIP